MLFDAEITQEDHVTAKLVTESDKAWSAADKALKYQTEGYRFSPLFKNKKWNGWSSLLTKTGNFPAGLVPRVKAAIEERGLRVSVTAPEPSELPDVLNVDLEGVTLRPHQEKALKSAIEERRGILHLSTNAGKTEVACAIIQALSLPVLFLVRDRSLATQTRKRFATRLSMPESQIGLIGAGSKVIKPVTVGMYQTIGNMIKSGNGLFLNQFKVLITDEVHEGVAKTYIPVLKRVNAEFRFGLSATWNKTNNRETELKVVGYFGEVIATYTPQEAVADKVSVQPYVTFIKWQKDEPKTTWKPWMFQYNSSIYPPHIVYKDCVVDNIERNAAVCEAAEAYIDRHIPTIVLVQQIMHGEKLADRLGVPFIHGGTDMDGRDAVMNDFRAGRIPAFVSSTIFDKGLDVANIAGIVLAGAGKAQHRQIQRIGRGMRLSEGKLKLEVADFDDTVAKTMWMQSRSRKEAYKKNGYIVEEV